ncbi:hypothetical protein KR100_07545 [Synechococcus sp. KORDI-100]|uniref:hypothetical protein n=1 Tax=Synechococcus sp. KORDI-100 TaxID=1280380 RepID=UPI0004E055C4|nr:hypothetical protein [Synechococcus sp. KORDI-100]AII43215.1 hypothetical protein KR100_07545 [Synechococcus sp. KORDI-100]
MAPGGGGGGGGRVRGTGGGGGGCGGGGGGDTSDYGIDPYIDISSIFGGVVSRDDHVSICSHHGVQTTAPDVDLSVIT